MYLPPLLFYQHMLLPLWNQLHQIYFQVDPPLILVCRQCFQKDTLFRLEFMKELPSFLISGFIVQRPQKISKWGGGKYSYICVHRP